MKKYQKIILRKQKKNIIDKRTYIFEKDHAPILVNSAFGGFGIYKLKDISDIEYNSNSGTYSEHVLFNLSILKKNSNKSLYIDQKLINFSGISEHFFRGIIYCLSKYYSKNLLEKFKIINKKN